MDELWTLHSLVSELPQHGDRPAVLALRKQAIEQWSYADLARHVRRLAQGLTEAGVRRSDRVAFLAANRPEWIVACLAVIEARAVADPIDVQLSDDVLIHVLNDSGSRLLFTTVDQVARLDRLNLKHLPRRSLLDAGENDDRSWRRLLSDKASELPPCQGDDRLLPAGSSSGR